MMLREPTMGTLLVEIVRGLFGMAVLILFCWCISGKRKDINWRLVGSGVLLQFIIAALILKVPFVGGIIALVSQFFVQVIAFSEDGARLVFGDTLTQNSFGAIIAFKVVPSIIFFSALSSILYYLGLLQKIVYGFAWVMQKGMGLSGAESLAAAANVFVGQTEAPLIVRPYLAGMNRSEMLCLMTGGMATIAGGVLVAYMSMLGGDSPERQALFGQSLLTASLLSAPAAVLVAKMILPASGPVNDSMTIPKEQLGENIFDAAVIGTGDGMKLAFNVAAVLIVFTGLVSLCNWAMVQGPGQWLGLNTWVESATGGEYTGFSMQFLLGVLFYPIAWLIGVDNGSLLLVGQLLGEKTVLNEFVAYANLGGMISDGRLTNQNSIYIATYALCGFSNFASMGIQIGGIGALVPSQRGTLAALAFKALIGGTVACLMTGCIAGIFLG